MGGRVWTLTQTDDTLWYHIYKNQDVTVHPSKEEEEMLRDYFQLNVNLRDLYTAWGAADPHFKHIADIFTGLCVCAGIMTSNINLK